MDWVPRAALTGEELEAFRRKAVDAAMGLFAEHGYRGVTLRSLAKVLGVSAMTPYRYFENKEELFSMVRAEAFRRFADAQRDAVAGIDEPKDALRMLGRAYVSFALDEPDVQPALRAGVGQRLRHRRPSLGHRDQPVDHVAVVGDHGSRVRGVAGGRDGHRW